jgi:tRNA pseudouridine55 synthase
LVDKPSGPTSHDVVSRVRRALKTRAVGHTGTLDPFATGLLLVLVGRATRLARFVAGEKTYLATVKLGVTTSTDDLTGDVVGGREAGEERANSGPIDREQVESVLAGFRGPQMQRPPAYSAKKIDGERSYAKARRGEDVELAEVDVVVHAIELLDYQYPDLQFRATVSAGTYLRSIGRDLGERLGIGAHLTALRREAIGALRVEDAVPLDMIEPEVIQSPLAVLGHLARLDLTDEEAKALGYGKALNDLPACRLAALPPDRPVTAVAPGNRLIAVGRVHDRVFQPEVVLEAAG